MTVLQTRIAQLRGLLAERDIDTLLVLGDANRRYLSGFTAEDHEIDASSGALLISGEKLVLATDGRYTIQAGQEAPLYEVVVYRRSPA